MISDELIMGFKERLIGFCLNGRKISLSVSLYMFD